MRVYTGQTRGARLCRILDDLGWREMLCPREKQPRRIPFACDNGAFVAWKTGQPFDAEGFLRWFESVARYGPDFVVVPDIVAGGSDSLAFSLQWAPRLRGIAPLYLAVQDGMQVSEVWQPAQLFHGLFVGGTVKWKIETGAQWVALAHSMGKPCHIGRVSTPKRIRWAQRIGADSIDSTQPLWSADELRKFVAALKQSPQLELAPKEARAE